MVRPDHFAFNSETAASNAFQNEISPGEKEHARAIALKEFDAFVERLKESDIDVHVFNSPVEDYASDAVFPNNWISFHEDGRVILYPMLTKNRRVERRQEIVDMLSKKFLVSEVVDISYNEEQGRILEGTGSIVFDHINRVAYANCSARTNKELFKEVCSQLGYRDVLFRAYDKNGLDIYHTNVLMAIGDGYAVICLDTLDIEDKERVIASMKEDGLEIIDISFEQMCSFAGNMIQLENRAGEKFVVMSQSAFESLSPDQKEKIVGFNKIISADLNTIETIGGGSARCMIAGIHLQERG